MFPSQFRRVVVVRPLLGANGFCFGTAHFVVVDCLIVVVLLG
tara:strand:- start:877 stop:1002 length:126 start_codon:yes stop_codon:yes gene_type:complete